MLRLLVLLALVVMLTGGAGGDAATTPVPHPAATQPAVTLPSDSLFAYPLAYDTTTVAGFRLAYVDTAPGEAEREAVLLIHGLGSNLSFWRETIPALEESYRVVALDLPGFGKSEKAGVSGRMTDYAGAAAALLGDLGIERAHVVGHSMGGQIATHFALAYPDRVLRLVLAAPAGVETFTQPQAAALTGMMTAERICSTTDDQVSTNARLNVAAWKPEFDWIVDERIAQKSAPDFTDYCAANSASIAGMLGEPVRERLGEIEASTLVVFGEDDALIPNRFFNPALTTESVAEAAAQEIPAAEMRLIEGAGHLLQLEQPEAFNAAVLAFLGQ